MMTDGADSPARKKTPEAVGLPVDRFFCVYQQLAHGVCVLQSTLAGQMGQVYRPEFQKPETG